MGADCNFHMVHHTFGDLRLAADVLFGDVPHGAIHPLIVVGRGDDEVAIGHLIVLIDVVMMDQRAASAWGVSIEATVFIRARGPTRYHPFSGPMVFTKGNFM